MSRIFDENMKIYENFKYALFLLEKILGKQNILANSIERISKQECGEVKAF